MLTRSEIVMVRSLSDKKGRTEYGLFVVEGRKMVSEAVASGLPVAQIYATSDAAAGFPDARIVSTSEFERISRLRSPQGILALVEIPSFEIPVVRKGVLTIAVDRIQDPGNLGTIIRIADWFGIRDIVCTPDTADCFNPKTVQATMGSLFRVRVHYCELGNFLAGAVSEKVPVFGAFMDGESIYECGPVREGVLVMGNEGNGISPGIEKYITQKINIPPFPAGNSGAESLNVAVAAGIIISHFRK